ncbi:uncharacterized protein JCM6883_005835 [Sporobolomyces salmoneus]|uniref:uncharacterized protein n=1 Tax=Sporobolomyces salmoneus TaxID=183962 RepID=UPI003171446C
MLQRPRAFDHNQENPYAAGPSTHHNPQQQQSHHHHKTPARPHGKGPAPVTGGKGAALTSTIGRGVLGRKDGNQGKGGGSGKDSALLFPSKPSTSQQQQSFKTPAPKPRSLRPLADLQTPATALRPKRAPVLVPSPEAEREVEVDVEAEEETKLREMLDQEVEYAGPSATDYEEPYEPECEVTDYKKANYGEFLRTMCFTGVETHEEWEARDAIERQHIEFPLEDTIQLDSDLIEEESTTLFPVPASHAPPRRAPLQSKPSTNALSSSVRSCATTVPARKPLVPSSSSTRRPLLQSTQSAPSTATQRALASSRQPTTSTSLSRSTTSKPIGSTSIRRPLAASMSTRPTSSLSQTSSSSTSRARPPPPSRAASSSVRKTSSTTLRQSSLVSAQRTQAETEAKKLRERREEEERKLGAFGLTEDVDGVEGMLLEGMELGGGGFGKGWGEDGEEFRLDLDSE